MINYSKITICLTIFSLCFLMFIGNFDFTAFNIAIPIMAKDFNSSIYESQWINISYITLASGLAVWGGFLSKYLGIKKAMILGSIIFALTSIFSGLSTSLSAIIVARSIQGIGYAIAFPIIYVCIFYYIPEKKRVMATTFLVASTAFAQAIGPLIAGYILKHYQWRMLFYINVPCCILIILAMCILTDIKINSAFQWKSLSSPILISSILITFMALININSQNAAINFSILGLLLFFVVMAFIFFGKLMFGFYLENKIAVLNLGIRFLSQIIFIIILFYPSMVFQVTLNFGPEKIGVMYLFFTGVFALATLVLSRLLNRKNAKHLLITGSLLLILGFSMQTMYYENGHYFLFRISLAFIGFGLGIIFPVTLFFNIDIESQHKALISSLFLSIALAGCSVGVAFSNHILGIFLDNNFIGRGRLSLLHSYKVLMLYSVFISIIIFLLSFKLRSMLTFNQSRAKNF